MKLEDLVLGNKSYEVGLDMKCNKIVTTVKLVSIEVNDIFDIVIESQSVIGLGNSKDLYTAKKEVLKLIENGKQ